MAEGMETYRELLLRQRRELIARQEQLGREEGEMQGREVEAEEDAQKTALAEPTHQFLERSKVELDDIDLALSKIAAGVYGLCEACEEPIGQARLRALAAVRLCRDCAGQLESTGVHLRRPAELLRGEVDGRVEGLTDAEHLGRVQAHLSRLGLKPEVDRGNLQPDVRRGVVYLDGEVADESLRSRLLDGLQRELGFPTVVDRLQTRRHAS